MSAELLRRIKDLEERVKALEALGQVTSHVTESVDLRDLQNIDAIPGGIMRQPLQKRPTITLKK